jgi:hypothetical protein
MAEQRKRNERFVSPSGRFIYPWLSTPDTKFDADGVYRLKLAVPAAECASFVEMIEGKYDDNLANNKAKVTKEGARPWELDEEANAYLFTFKMKAVVTTKTGEQFTQRPSLFDASGAILGNVKVGGGTVGKISFEVIPYANKALGAGISLRLKAVQIIDLVEFGVGDADSFGFAEEEGYVANTGSDFEDEAAEGASEGYDF